MLNLNLSFSLSSYAYKKSVFIYILCVAKIIILHVNNTLMYMCVCVCDIQKSSIYLIYCQMHLHLLFPYWYRYIKSICLGKLTIIGPEWRSIWGNHFFSQAVTVLTSIFFGQSFFLTGQLLRGSYMKQFCQKLGQTVGFRRMGYNGLMGREGRSLALCLLF